VIDAALQSARLSAARFIPDKPFVFPSLIICTVHSIVKLNDSSRFSSNIKCIDALSYREIVEDADLKETIRRE
jgi:hypothetical protein